MSAPRANPYNPSNPVIPRHFAGREAEIAEIRSLLKAAHVGSPSSVFIKGEWGIGKTSLINKLLPEFGEHAMVVREDVATGSQTVQTKAFYPALFQELVAETDLDFEFDLSYTQPRMIRKRLINLLTALWEEKGLLVVIILDNLERADPPFLAGLKDVFQRVRDEAPHFMLVFAGKILPGTGGHASDPVTRFFQTIHIVPLSEEESLEAILKPLKFVPDFRITREGAALIAERANGHPYFLKRICYDVFQIAGGEGDVDPAWLDAHWEEIEARLSKARFFEEYDILPDAQQNALLHASVQGNEFRRSDIQDMKSLDTALHRLRERELIKTVSRGVYAFYHPLFGTYIRHKAAAAGIKAPDTALGTVERMIAAGEGQKIEFKETLSFNVRSSRKDPRMSHEVLRTIAAFHNADGGTLLIGVADDGTVMGLDQDMKIVHNKNRDGFERHLLGLIRGHLKPVPDPRTTISFESVEGRDICVVSVPRLEDLTYLDNDLYLREGPQSKKIEDAAERERIIRKRSRE